MRGTSAGRSARKLAAPTPNVTLLGEWRSARRCRMTTSWNKEQAALLRRIALAGGKYRADECRGPTLEALIAAGFVRLEGRNRVALTDAGAARARQLRFRRLF